MEIKIKSIHFDATGQLKAFIEKKVEKLSKTYEEYGYKYFYEVEDEEMTETCEANGWEFLEDGSYYVA